MSEDEDETREICRSLISQPLDGQGALFRPRKDTFNKFYVTPLPHCAVPPRVGLPLAIPPIRQLTVPEIFEALDRYADRKFYRIFKPIPIDDVSMCDVFVYTLISSYERRYTKWIFVPYKQDDPVDEPTQTNRIIDPWLVTVPSEEKFKEHSKVCKVPRSDFIMTCHKCEGLGTVTCPWCDGRGINQFGRCQLCLGSKKYKCTICDGHKKIKLYLVTKVKWSTKVTSKVIDTSFSGIKNKTFLNRHSTTVLYEELESVPFIAQFFDNSNLYQKKLADAANRIIMDHELCRGKFKKIILQRQTVHHIPIAVIRYSYKNTLRNFHIIGKERKVFFPHPPSSLCTIL